MVKITFSRPQVTTKCLSNYVLCCMEIVVNSACMFVCLRFMLFILYTFTLACFAITSQVSQSLQLATECAPGWSYGSTGSCERIYGNHGKASMISHNLYPDTSIYNDQDDYATLPTGCIACLQGQFAAPGTTECITPSLGNHWSGGSLVPCAPGTFLANISHTIYPGCSPCNAGEYQPNPGATSCLKCPKGTYSEPRSTYCASTCNPGFAPLTGTKKCEPCHAGFFSTGIACAPCRRSGFSGEGFSDCVQKCDVEWVKQIGSRCVACQGKTWNPTGKKCEPCPAGLHLKRNPTMCTACEANEFWDARASTCVTCPDNAAAIVESCQGCQDSLGSLSFQVKLCRDALAISRACLH